MNSLHDKILNIPFTNRVFNKKEEKTAYRLGHHDARHAAVELDMEADALNGALLEALKEAMQQMEMAAECVENGSTDEALLHLRSLMRQKKKL